MRPPDSLPARVYLLAFDRERDKLTGRLWMGYTIRAAALAELRIRGHIIDVDGHAAIPPGAQAPAEASLGDLWAEVAETPRKWESLVSRHRRQAVHAVTTRLDAAGYIRIVRPATRWRSARIDIRDPLVLTRLNERVGALLRGPQRMDRIPVADATLVGLLAVASMRTAITKANTKEYADRIEAAVTASGPEVAGLKRALKQARSSIS